MKFLASAAIVLAGVGFGAGGAMAQDGGSGSQQKKSGGISGETGGYGAGEAAPGGGAATATGGCKQLKSCYSSLTRQLCTEGDANCQSVFTVPKGTSESRCNKMLTGVSELAQKYIKESSTFQMPSECNVSGAAGQTGGFEGGTEGGMQQPSQQQPSQQPSQQQPSPSQQQPGGGGGGY